jgi:ATP-binding cassette subfamily C protein
MGRGGLHGLLAWQAVRLFLKLGFSGSAALLVGQLIMDQNIQTWVLLAVPAFLALATLGGLVADRVQASAETKVATVLREAAGRRLADMPARQLQSLSAGSLIVAMQRHPEAVAALVIGHRAATIMMAVGPLAAAAMLILVSWQAALLVVGLTPLMIVFFALVGEAIRRLADAQERSFGRLAGQFADRIRTLPTILANHALATEEDKLADRLQAHAANTMGVLRIAFLNAGIIDFFASLSIAMLAVFLGLGHLKLAMIPGFSNLELWQSLFILMIAPDYYAPFRRFSEQYHAKAEGVAAAAALDRLLDSAAPEMPDLPALVGIAEMPMPARGLVAIVGPSGSGKSTLLRRIAGVDPANALRSERNAPAEFTWIATDCHVPEGTLGDAIAWNVDDVAAERILLAAGSVGLLDDELLPGGLAARVDKGGANLSGGQRLRIAVARAALTGRTVIADEPTAKLDPVTAASIRRVLSDISRSRLVIAATHDEGLAALADRAIVLAENEPLEAAA